MDIFKLLGAIAPTISKAITGNIGGAVEEALKAFGITSGTQDDLSRALKNATPEQIAELKKIDAAYKQRLAELDVDLEKIFADDRSSARNMYMQTKDKLVPALALFLVGGAFATVVALFFVKVPDSNKDILYMSLGIVIGYASNVVTFYFGSSKSSADKNQLLLKAK